MEMTLERAKALAATVLLDEVCPDGHRGPHDGLFDRTESGLYYCPECQMNWPKSLITLEPMELVQELEVV